MYEADIMEKILNLHIEELPEGVYFATSNEMPGLVAQGRTVSETLEIARDVAKKLIESQKEKQEFPILSQVEKKFDYPLIIGAQTWGALVVFSIDKLSKNSKELDLFLIILPQEVMRLGIIQLLKNIQLFQIIQVICGGTARAILKQADISTDKFLPLKSFGCYHLLLMWYG